MATTFFALGGLGRIGMNCLALEAAGNWLLVDCGMRMGPSELGVGIVEPDLDWLVQRQGKMLGVVLTHGHEDHLGTLPSLLTRRPMPVWAPPYAKAYLEAKLRDDPITPAPELKTLEVGGQIQLGPFTVRSIRVTHSTADATSLVIDTPDGRILHTGDFKLDPAPVDEQPFDAAAYAQLGLDGLDVLLSDSTNAMTRGHTTSESALREPLASLVSESAGRVMISLFASNTHRLRTLFSVAEQTRRRVCLLGRSVRRHVETAQQTGHLPRIDRMLVSPREAARLERHSVLYIATGSQGEGNAALFRVLQQEHVAELGAGDRLILSARVIPGNEKRVYRLLNGFAERGVEVFFPPFTQDIHASGHAYRDELRWMIRSTQPRYFVPLHGTRMHLEAHAKLAQEEGVENIQLFTNGESLVLENGELQRGEAFDWDEVFRSQSGHVLDRNTMRDRNRIARHGACFVCGSPGDLYVEEVGTGASQAQLNELEDVLCNLADRDTDEASLQRQVRRFFKKELGTRPEIRVALIDTRA